jgi:plastocyanin
VRSKQGWSGRFTTEKNAQGLGQLTIDIVAVVPPGEPPLGPGFEPSVITGSPGQKLKVTVYQAKDASANFQHNFSIDSLQIDKDIPQGAGNSISVTVMLPQSGSLTFYCKYHVAVEQHAGEFLIAR